MYNLNWGLIRYALFTYRKGSASGAAEALNVTHATVIRGLKKLETETNTTLFNKSPSGYTPTDNGKLLIAAGEKMEAEIYQWKRNIESEHSHPSGLLQITTTEAILNSLICPHLSSFNLLYPDIKLEFSTSYEFNTITNHAFDIAIRSTSTPPEHLIGRKVKHVQWGVYHHVSNHAGDDEWVGFNNNSAPASQWLSTLFPNANVKCSASSILSQLEAVKAGIGQAILPCFLADTHADIKKVQSLPDDFTTEIWLLYHRESRDSPKIQAFINWLKTYVF